MKLNITCCALHRLQSAGQLNLAQVRVLQVDLSKEENIVELMQDIREFLEGHHVDILVNNAACFLYQAAEDVTEAGEAVRRPWKKHILFPARKHL